MYACMYACMHVCMYVCMCACRCVCVRVYVCVSSVAVFWCLHMTLSVDWTQITNQQIRCV